MVMFEPMQDAVKSLGLVRKLVHDLLTDCRSLMDVYEARKHKAVRGALVLLSVQEGDIKQNIGRIVEGSATMLDYEAVSAKLEDTAEEIEDAIDRIVASRESIAEKYGLAIANQLDQLIYGAGGKIALRYDVGQIVYIGYDQNPDPEIASVNAQHVLKMMGSFNERIEGMHETLRAAKGSAA